MSPEDFLASLPEERREALTKVHQTISKNLAPGFKAVGAPRGIHYVVPLKDYPDTYNGQPYMYASLASNKAKMVVYLMGIYMDENLRAEFEAEYKASGKKLDAGKSCVRFKTLEDLPLDVVARSVGKMKMKEFAERMQAITSKKK